MNQNFQFSMNPSIESYYLINRWKTQHRKKILDLGSGNGRHALQFANQGFETYALDISDDFLTMAKRNTDNSKTEISFQKGDMHNLPFEDNYFDCILSYDAIYHTNSVGIKKALSEVYRVLKLKGEAYLTFLSKESWHWINAERFLDDHTFLKVYSLTEKNVPHYCTDFYELQALLINFEIENQYAVKRMINRCGKYVEDCHYHVLVRKK